MEKSRFKVKNGEMEIEYEGSVNDVNQRYKEALDWLKATPIAPTVQSARQNKGNNSGKKQDPETEEKEAELKSRFTRLRSMS